VLCEKSALASGASGRSSALVRMHYTNEWDARLAFASFPVFKHWPEIMGGPPCSPTPVRERRRPAVRRRAPEERRDAARHRRQHRRPVPGRAPGLQPFANVEDLGAAAWEPESGYADPAATVEGFRRRGHELGARILQWTGVTKILRRESRVVGVETRAGRIDAAPSSSPPAPGPASLPRDGIELPARVKGLDTVQVTRPAALASPT